MLLKVGIGVAAAISFGIGIGVLSVAVNGLPVLETMPALSVPAYLMAGIGGALLVIVVWRLATLRVIRAFFSTLSAVIVAYYPVAYAAHFSWLKYQQFASEDVQEFVNQNAVILDYGLMALCLFLGLLILSLTMGERPLVAGSLPAGVSPRMTPGYVPDKCSPGIALVLTFFYPGLGQMYSGQILKGLFIMLWPAIFLFGVCCIGPVLLAGLTQHAQDAHEAAGGKGQIAVVPLVNPFVLILLGVIFNVFFYVWALYDAYASAEYINEEHRRRYGSY